MEKIDLMKMMVSEYAQKPTGPKIVNVGKHKYLTIEGTGDPNNNSYYSEAVGTLFSLAYALKFHVKRSELAIDYSVMPLEGLWWTDDMSTFSLECRENWFWKMMILQPDFVTADLVEDIKYGVIQKKGTQIIDEIKFEIITEGTCAQIFHQGGYGIAEKPSVDLLHQFIQISGYLLAGRHHEIYLNSPTRVPTEKLRTLIRQPFTNNANQPKNE